MIETFEVSTSSVNILAIHVLLEVEHAWGLLTR